ncbi:MAG: superfamily II DNA or RNA helicase [Chlamydiales bacterium]
MWYNIQILKYQLAGDMKAADLFDDYRVIAEEYLDKGYVGELSFSGRTYQIQVKDEQSGEEIWPFMQFSEEGLIKDYFCSCPAAEEAPACEHLAAACMRIFNGHPDPLHLRFKESLWNQLCELYAFRQGFDTDVLKKIGEGHYVCEAVSGKTLFFVRGKSEDANRRLKIIIDERTVETEETSLKFSDLSQEDIALWREGRPRAPLRYELSFWSDFAKWLMWRQDVRDSYEINFRFDDEGIPNQIWIDFEDLSLAFYVSEANLPGIIPSLSTVDTTLPVYNFNEEAIEEISYDENNKQLLIKLREELVEQSKDISNSTQGPTEKYYFGDWLYVPNDGFYFRGEHSLLALPIVDTIDIPAVLDEHLHIIERHLIGAHLHMEPVSTHYEIFFDNAWNLHLNCYVIELGDLQKPNSAYFGNWAYVAGDGFYSLENACFESAEKVVPYDEVSKFVHKYRSWLNKQEGFHTHLSSVEDRLVYTLTEDETLCFESRVDISGDAFEGMDFGDWVYIKNQGFYTKMRERIGLPVRSGVLVPVDEIPTFIRMNQEDLEYVRDFFSVECPVVKAGLNIKLKGKTTIVINPEYELLPRYRSSNIRFFGDFVYSEGEGFHEIPLDTRLPDEFRHQTIIRGDRLGLFLTYELDDIRCYANHIDKRLAKGENPCFTVHNVSGEEALEEKGLLTFNMSYETEFGKVPITDVWKGLRKGRRYLFTNAGLIDLQNESFQWLRNFGEHRVDAGQGSVKLTVLEFIRLNAFEKVKDPPEDLEEAADSRKLLRNLRELQVEDKPNLDGLKSNLRPYQEIGVDWLWFLYNHHLSGLLCDDMGLGKTHQAMALMVSAVNVEKKKKGKRKYFLVVCPTSVIYHWQEKLAEFLPELKVCTFHGMNRSLDGFLKTYDILLTSYGIMRREKDIISLISFDLAIFDEIQVAKNHLSKLHSALLTVQTRMRIGLTGTPIENQLRELKSLFDVVLPTYMPSDGQYRDLFVNPIEKDGDADRKKLLGRFVHPFLLRRKKEEVLEDLPEKTEEISHCELSLEQMKLYKDVLNDSRKSLIVDLADGSKRIPYIHIFAVLMKLKQLCNHPALILQDIKNYQDHSSGKWDLFVEILNQAQESGQKVVVFSQYLGMLDIIENYLQASGIGFASLRGATANRGKEMKRFQEDPECKVFVASLLAAGLGIDLTAASVVIHYDRWWNAAREDQATDRVHRIGQTRGVQVFKLVTLGTLEEKIDKLIAKKGALMEDVVGSDGQGQLKRFDRDELIELLQFVDGPEDQNTKGEFDY